MHTSGQPEHCEQCHQVLNTPNQFLAEKWALIACSGGLTQWEGFKELLGNQSNIHWWWAFSIFHVVLCTALHTVSLSFSGLYSGGPAGPIPSNENVQPSLQSPVNQSYTPTPSAHHTVTLQPVGAMATASRCSHNGTCVLQKGNRGVVNDTAAQCSDVWRSRDNHTATVNTKANPDFSKCRI